jgi:Carbohydrate esterase, sialic acid-specific acetylesterase
MAARCTLASLVVLALLGVPILPAEEIIIDNDDGAPTYVETGTWTTSGITGHDGLTYRFTTEAPPFASAEWNFTVTTTGSYEVYAIFRTGSNRPTGARYTVTHFGGSSEVIVDQTGDSSIVELLFGDFVFESGVTGSVSLDNTGSAGYHIADAIRVVTAVNDPPEITGLAISPELPGVGETVTVTATITDIDSLIASAELEYILDPGGGPFIVPALDDGAHGDGAADDDVFGSAIPPQASGVTVTYLVRAADDQGLLAASASSAYTVDLMDDPMALAFIIAGQSNASGRGELNESTETPHPRVLMFGNDYRWRVATEPIDDATDQVDLVSSELAIYGFNPRHSLALRAGKDLVAAGASSIHLIPCALGASRIVDWRRSVDPFDRSTLFGSMNWRRSVAAPGGLTALWWYQGESDSGSSTFIADNTALMAEMRAEMGAALPIIYVQLNNPNRSDYHHGAELQRRMESGSGDPAALSDHHMVVTMDLGMSDTAHLDQAGVKELGRRVALATRQHVLGHAIDGTGPRLSGLYPITHPGDDRSLVRIQFSQPINEAVNAYDNLFRVFDDGVGVSISAVQRDPSNPSAVLIDLPSAIAGAATVQYGITTESPPLLNAVQNSEGLPAPRFGPLEVVLESVPAALTGLGLN